MVPKQTLRRWCAGLRVRACAAVAILGVAGFLAVATRSASAQGSPPVRVRAGFMGAYLMPPRPGKPPPPGIGPAYRAYEIITGTDMRQRPWGFAQCLREVLVKASGDPRLRNDPRVAALAAHADRFVAGFTYADMMAGIPLHDDQGTYDRPYKLTVYFDPARIDAVLAQLGERPWRGVRPVIVPVLLVRGLKPPPYVLSAHIPEGADQRGSFVNAAHEFGLRVRFPGKAELGAWGASAERFPSRAARLPAGQMPSEMVVLGTLRWNETLPGWIGRWRTRWHGVVYAWGVSGVTYDDAFRDIARGVLLLAAGHGPPN